VKRAIREHYKDFGAILGLLLIAGAVSALILTQQRFRFPLISEKPQRMYAELDNAQAVTPGQGQTVEIAGVKIGLIANVTLRDGHAVIGLDIKPRFKNIIHTDAKGLLRPRTGLKDMFLQVDPGTSSAPLAKSGFTIPAARTLTDVDLDEILSSLDSDTRDHLQLLLGGAAGGLKGRGMDLAELFRRFGPTNRDLRRVNQAVAVERGKIEDGIHGLSQLTGALAGKSDDLARLVDSSASVFESFASEDRNVSATVQKLPAALQTTTRTLSDVQRFADQLGPTARSLTPVFQTLDRTNRVITPIAKQLTPIIGNEIRPFVREARPLVANLRPAATGLSAAMPDLTTVGSKLNTLFNLLAFNPNGAEPADKASRQEGYLFWMAWLTHQTENLINVDDANGPMRPIFLTGTCNTLTNLVNNQPGLEFLLGLSGVLSQQCSNPTTTSILPGLAKKRVAKQASSFDKTRKASQQLLSGSTAQSALKTILGGAK
jgi:phospholipid/cholesterol/gamma-HCH transport system substrate-binding protein